MGEIDKCVDVLKRGGVIIYPTDTIWGLGCDATNKVAVAKLNQIKQREKEGLIILVCDERMLMNHVKEIPEIAWDIIETSIDPVTIIFDHGISVSPEVTSSDGSIAVRLIRDGFANDVMKKLRRPITSTSANISGETPPKNYDEINSKLFELVDYHVPADEDISVNSRPSSIIKLSGSGEIEIIRR